MDILSLFKFHIYILSCKLVLSHSLTTSPSLSTYASFENDSIVPAHSAISLGPSSFIAYRVEEGWSETESGVLYIYSDMKSTFRLVGTDFGTKPLDLAFTTTKGPKGLPCDDLRTTGIFHSTTVEGQTALFDVILPQGEQILYFCIRGENKTTGKSQFVHLGDDPWMSLGLKVKPVKTYILPFWLQILVVVILLIFSGLFSGLNLGLMSLDQTELNIMIASGTVREKQYAKTIMPLRKRGNFLLCTILLGNVLVNNCLTILLDDLTGSGWMAIVGATLAIVIFGEILPQAVCSRYGLAVGARTIWFTRFFMMLTFPLSFPISLILDRVLGEEIGYVYNRDRLRELLKLAEKDIGLVTDEVNIITGALELSKKTVAHIMTKIDDVFMIEYNSVLDFETVTKIMDSGYTRIPVYEKDRSNVVALLNTKDLAFVDPDDKIPLNTVTKFYNHILLFVFEDVKLDVILQDFKKGGSHMAMVQSVVSDGPGDPYYKVVGLVTLEDVIEEIIQSEIYDEFDTVTDNRLKQPRGIRQKDYSVFNVPSHHNLPRLTPQLQLASFQFLSGLTPFKLPYISERILYKLMTQDIVLEHKQQPGDPPFFLYLHGRPADYFVLVVQGRVLVQSGLEHLTYEAGSFSYFGLQSLLVKGGRGPSYTPDRAVLYKSNPNVSDILLIDSQSRIHQSSLRLDRSKSSGIDPTLIPAAGPFVPDFTVRALTNLQYLKITREQYMIAYRASQLEQELLRGNVTDSPEETFEREWKSCNPLFLENTVDTKSSKRYSSSHMSSPSFASAYTPGASTFFQQVRRTLGFSHYSQNDSVNLSTKQEGSPPSTKASTPPSRLKSSAYVPQGAAALKKGVKWSENEATDSPDPQARKPEAVQAPSKEQSPAPVRRKSIDKKVTEQDKSNRDKKDKGAPGGKNLTSNSIPDDSGEPLPFAENSKMETEALLQDLEQIEVKVVKP